MKKILLSTAIALAAMGANAQGPSSVFEYKTTPNQMEKLTRGLVVVPGAQSGNFISWRMLGTDGIGALSNVTFDLLKNGTVLKANISDVSNYEDKYGDAGSAYSLVVKVNGKVVETTPAVKRWTKKYKEIQLDRPTDTRGLGCLYAPNDMSAADLDGDGEYELIVKWNPTNSRDNSQEGVTGTVYIDAYKMDGTKLWRIDMGKNIRAGAHYTQFLAYDFDGDGKAEVMCKTAPGTKDGKNNYVSAAGDETIQKVDNSSTLYNSKGYVNSGDEFLTVFNGETGAAMHTINYSPNRALNKSGGAASYSSSWGDSYGGRGDRYNAAVAYLDGMDKLPSAVFQRGYYTQAFFWAVDWDGKELKTKWLHYGISKTSWYKYDSDLKFVKNGSGKSSYGQGVHGISVGDVNNDGFDEIVMGGATIAHDGTLLCSTGLGHGDAIHLSDLCPDRPGLEIMMPHEESPYGYDVHDATTGELIVSATSSSDNGRGIAADMIASNRGFEFSSQADNNLYSCATGKVLGSKRPNLNFRIYWDGDLQDELFDGKYTKSTDDALKQTDINGTYAPVITKMNASATSQSTLVSFGTSDMGMGSACNTTKSTPCLVADLFGDWREEVVLWNHNDPSKINIYTTSTKTTYGMPTLMHDHVYRMGIAWQNSSYNQPPHLGFYLPDMFDSKYGVYSDAFIKANQKKGDVNGDGIVNIDDVSAVIDVICGGAANPRADVDGNGDTDIDDVSAVIAIICGN